MRNVSDERLIRALHDGPGTTSELGREVGLSAAVVAERLEHLAAQGVITGRSFNAMKIDFGSFVPETIWELARYEVAA